MSGRNQGVEQAAAEYLAKVEQALPGLARPHHGYYFASVFDGLCLAGARALDVGAGDGLYTGFLAAAGCDAVVALEPEAAGGRDGMNETFAGLVRALALDNVTLAPETFQDFSLRYDGAPFDLVLLQHSINHLDEALVVDLHRDPPARRAYGEIIGHLRRLTRLGGSVVVTDCARRNLFGDHTSFILLPLVPATEQMRGCRVKKACGRVFALDGA